MFKLRYIVPGVCYVDLVVLSWRDPALVSVSSRRLWQFLILSHHDHHVFINSSINTVDIHRTYAVQFPLFHQYWYISCIDSSLKSTTWLCFVSIQWKQYGVPTALWKHCCYLSRTEFMRNIYVNLSNTIKHNASFRGKTTNYRFHIKQVWPQKKT